MKIRRLKSLKIRRIDLVDKGAAYDAESGEGAHVVLFKHADSSIGDKAAVAAQGGKMADEQDTSAEVNLRDELDAAKAEVVKRDAEQAQLAKRLEDAEKRIEKAEDEKKLAEFVKRAEVYKFLPIDAEKFGALLKKASASLNADELGEIERILKAADEAAAPSFRESGRGGFATKAQGANDEFNRLVDSTIEKAAGKMNRLTAMSKVAAEHPELYERIRQEALILGPSN